MKNCPNCNAEVENNFELCWNCNYSFNEQRIVDIKDMDDGGRSLDCLRCQVELLFSGRYKFHEGTKMGILGNLFELFVNREAFDLYICPKCGKVEFYAPLDNSEYKLEEL